MTFYRSRIGHSATNRLAPPARNRLAPAPSYRNTALGSVARNAVHRALDVSSDGIVSDLPGASIAITVDGDMLSISEVSPEGEVTDAIELPLYVTPAEDAGEGDGSGNQTESLSRNQRRRRTPRQVSRMSWERNPMDSSITFTPADNEVLDVDGDSVMAVVTAIQTGA